MKCPKCGIDLEICIRFTPKRVWKGLICAECKTAYHPTNGGLDERMDLSGLDSDLTVMTLGARITIQLNDEEATLSPSHATLFCRAMTSLGHGYHFRERAARIKHEELMRWMMHRGGAVFRDMLSREFHVTLRKTTPRRDWCCSTCNRRLRARHAHWVGEFAKKHWGEPKRPRFCHTCVLESRDVELTVAATPKGLHLVPDETLG
jgi:hypothetical protein